MKWVASAVAFTLVGGGGGGGGRTKKQGCGSEMVFRWAERVQFWQNEGFFYCRVNELMVRSSIEAFAIKVAFFPIRAGQ